MQYQNTTQIITSFSSISSVNELVKNMDAFLIVIKDDVRCVCHNNHYRFYDFEWVYSQSCSMLMRSLQKTHLKAIKRFYNNINIQEASKWIVQRLVSNMMNITLNPNYTRYITPPIFLDLDDYVASVGPPLIDIEDLYKVSRTTLIDGLKKVWKEGMCDEDFDQKDFEELCSKFSIDPLEVLGLDFSLGVNTKVEQTDGGHQQLVLVF